MSIPRSTCNTCHKKVMAHSKSVKCTLCLDSIHTKCLPYYSASNITHAETPSNSWSCLRCLATIFPFSCIEDPLNFQDSINNPINQIPDILQLQDMVYDPFLTTDDDGRGVLGDIDPDLNFLHDIRGSLIQNWVLLLQYLTVWPNKGESGWGWHFTLPPQHPKPPKKSQFLPYNLTFFWNGV